MPPALALRMTRAAAALILSFLPLGEVTAATCTRPLQTRLTGLELTAASDLHVDSWVSS